MPVWLRKFTFSRIEKALEPKKEDESNIKKHKIHKPNLDYSVNH